MNRARRARRIAAAAAFGGGGVGVLGAAGFGLLVTQARMARRWIGRPFGHEGPQADRVYGFGAGRQLELAMLGDSSAAGLGAEDPDQTAGAVIAAGLAAITGRQVRLTVVAVVGAESSALAGQVDRLLAGCPAPDAAVIMIGANDVTHRVKPAVAVRSLGAAVRRLRETGAEVVVGTCPDLGTVEPLPPPLRHVARLWSRQLAAAQTIAVVEAGGRTVSLGDLLGPEFAARPREMFSSDRFHPSAAGYARAAAVLLPSVVSALDLWPQEQPTWPSAGRVDVDDVAHAAARASRTAGTEVVGTEVDGATLGPHGRWAVSSLRRGAAVVASSAASTASTVASTASTVASGAWSFIPGGWVTPPDPAAGGTVADPAAGGTMADPAAGDTVTDPQLPAGRIDP